MWMCISTCCCCCCVMPVEKGSRIISIVIGVLSAIAVVRDIWDLVKGSAVEDHLDQHALDPLSVDDDTILKNWHTVQVMRLVDDIITCLACVALFFGVRKRTKWLVLVFLVVFGVSTLLSVILVIWVICQPELVMGIVHADMKDDVGNTHEFSADVMKILVRGFFGLVLLMLSYPVYLWLVVLAYYKELSSAQREQFQHVPMA